MISALNLQPITKTSYTERGNEYKESNIGKYAAGAGVIGATTFYGGKYAIKGIKKVAEKAKIIKIDFPKIKKPEFQSLKKSVPGMGAIKVFINNVITKSKVLGNKGLALCKNAVSSVAKNVKKIDMDSIKKAGQEIVKFAKKPSIKYAAGVATALVGIVALGYVADAIANKINAHKADKV